MKIAVSTDGQRLRSQVSPVFGRCPYFTVVEIEDGEVLDSNALENSGMGQPSGAGTAAVQLLGDEGVDVVISGAVGPKALSALKQWGIEIFKAEPESVEKNIDKFLSEELEKIKTPTGPAGMGIGGKKRKDDKS